MQYKKKKYIKGITAFVVGLLVAGGIYFMISPMPVVQGVRYIMNRPANLTYPTDYANREQEVEIHQNLTYQSADGNNQFDLYLPKEQMEKYPVVIWIHGGAFVAGAKSAVKNWGIMLASEGVGVVAVDYEMAPEITYPGQLRQVQECITYLKQQKNWNFDWEKVIIAGDSSGAHIAAQCALVTVNEEYAAAIGVEPALEKHELEAMLLFCGFYEVERILNTKGGVEQFLMKRIGWALFGEKNFQELPILKTANINDYVTKDFPRCFITDGNKGSFETHGKALVDRLVEKGVETETLFFDPTKIKTGHGYHYDLTGEAGAECYKRVVGFLKGV